MPGAFLLQTRSVMITKNCEYCGQEFHGKRSDARFCSSTCKARAWDQKTINKEEPTIQDSLRGVIGGSPSSKAPFHSPKTTQIGIPNPQYNSLSFQLKFLLSQKNQLQQMQKKLMDRKQQLLTDLSSIFQIGMMTGGAYLADRTMQKPVNVILGGIAGGFIHRLYMNYTHQEREKTKQQDLTQISVQLTGFDVQLTSLEKKIANLQQQLKNTPKTIFKSVEAPMKSIPLDAEQKSQISVQNRPKDVQKNNEKSTPTPPFAVKEVKIKTSIDVGKMEFKALRFLEAWQEFLGLPALDFSMAIHGLPGQGKSTFALLFALYLAENFGRVLYITAEEGFSKTMQDKLKLNEAFHPDLHIADLRSMEDIITEVKTNTYHFIFIDSLNKLHIDTEGMRELRKRYQGAAFITVSQSTKDGKLRGSQEIVHDCDIAIEVKEGIARTTKNRFQESPREYSIFKM